MQKSILLPFLAALFISSFSSHAVYAEIKPQQLQEKAGDTETENANADTDENASDTKPLDGIGLYDGTQEESLGPNIWAGMNTAQLAEKISQLPADAQSPTGRSLILRALLTQYDPATVAPAKEEKAAPQTNSDLIAVRLKKLNGIGAFEESFQLYKKAGMPTSSEFITTEGMTSMIATGKIALACLEEKALDTTIKQDQTFWAELNLLCDQYLSPAVATNENIHAANTKEQREIEDAQNKQKLKNLATAYILKQNITAPKTIKEAQPLSSLQLSMLAGSGTWSLEHIQPIEYTQLSTHQLSILLNWHNGRSEDLLSITAAGLLTGLTSIDKLENLYQAEIQKIYAIGKNGKKPSLQTLRGWHKFLALYDDIIKGTDPATTTESLKSMLAMESEMGIAAYLPLATAPSPIQINETSLSSSQAKQWLRIKLMAHKLESAALIQTAFAPPASQENTPQAIEEKEKSEEQTGESPPRIAESLIIFFSPANSLNNEKSSKSSDTSLDNNKKSVEKNNEDIRATSRKEALSLVLKPFLDNPAEFSHNPVNIYEKDVDLTTEGDYVMPTVELQNSLTYASDKQLLGPVVLDSLIVLGSNAPAKLDPAILGDILEGLSHVGLTKEALAFADEAKLGFLREKD